MPATDARRAVETAGQLGLRPAFPENTISGNAGSLHGAFSTRQGIQSRGNGGGHQRWIGKRQRSIEAIRSKKVPETLVLTARTRGVLPTCVSWLSRTRSGWQHFLRKGLTEEGHAVDLAGCGEEALDRVAGTNYDVIVLDIMLPGIDGFAVCRHLRQDRVQTPILFLTAREAVCDRIAGLDAGADDYLIKPFDFAELVARLRALYRRPAETVPTVLRVGGSRSTQRAVRSGAAKMRFFYRRRNFASLNT